MENGVVGQRHEAVGKALWNKQLGRVVCVKHDACPLAKSGRPNADVHCHIKHCPAQHLHQLGLTSGLLEVETPNHAPGGRRYVVLYEANRPNDFLVARLVEGLVKMTSIVNVASGFD